MRKPYSAAFKAQIVLEVLKETKTVAQFAFEHQLHPNLVTKWKQEAVAELPIVIERKNTQAQAQEAQEQKVAQLYEQRRRDAQDSFAVFRNTTLQEWYLASLSANNISETTTQYIQEVQFGNLEILRIYTILYNEIEQNRHIDFDNFDICFG